MEKRIRFSESHEYTRLGCRLAASACWNGMPSNTQQLASLIIAISRRDQVMFIP
jgi:hypothetical protein